MHKFANKRRACLVAALLVFALPALAQQKRSTTTKRPEPSQIREATVTPAVTFDSLLSDETYKVYCEVRAVGTLIHSPALQDILDPVISLARPPKEFKTLVKWLNAHAEPLAGARMMVAGWPSRPNVPNVLMAIEFSNPDEAQKFERELRGFIPTLFPAPSPPPVNPSSARSNAAGTPNNEKESRPAPPPYQLKQSGTLVLISDRPVEFLKLRPRGSKLLEEDSNFALARNRFASESLFLYVDFKSIEKEEKEQRQKWEAEEHRRFEDAAAQRSKRADVAAPADVDSQSSSEPPSPEESPAETSTASSGTLQITSGQPTSNTPDNEKTPIAAGSTNLDIPDPKESAELSAAFYSLYAAFIGGESKWPEGIAAGIAFEDDAYVVRTLLLNGPENNANALPFLPQFVSGAAMVPQSPSVFPADTTFFVTASLDYPQIYEGMVKAIASAEETARKYPKLSSGDPMHGLSPFAIYEKKLGIKIKDELLPLFGNELALGIPGEIAIPAEDNSRSVPAETENGQPKPSGATQPIPVIAIAVKDKEAVRKLIPKLVESLAFKGANIFAQTEKREETEITSYANTFSYAFVGDFLVLSPDVNSTRRMVDSYLKHQTLSSDSRFRNATRWQPRQVLGLVYVGPDMMQRYYPGASGPSSDKLKDFLSRLGPEVEPMSYALSNEGLGPLHELHMPRNLLMLMIAGMSSTASQSSLAANEAIAKSVMRTVVTAEVTFQATEGNDRYATLDELVTKGLISKDMLQKYGYRVEITTSSNKFEATAIPLEYGVTGKLSFFTDESGVVRGGDHGGGAATISDKEIGN